VSDAYFVFIPRVGDLVLQLGCAPYCSRSSFGAGQQDVALGRVHIRPSGGVAMERRRGRYGESVNGGHLANIEPPLQDSYDAPHRLLTLTSSAAFGN